MKTAVCVGINYVGTNIELTEPVRDANIMQTWLRGRGYSTNVLLNEHVTRQSVLNAIKTLLDSLKKPNDVAWFHMSGHGGQIGDKDHDEADRHDEVVVVSDGQVVDDDIYQLLKSHDRQGKIIFTFDTCSSGTMADLCGLKCKNLLVWSLSACPDSKTTFEMANWGGYFTNALILANVDPAVVNDIHGWQNSVHTHMVRGEPVARTNQKIVTSRSHTQQLLLGIGILFAIYMVSYVSLQKRKKK